MNDFRAVYLPADAWWNNPNVITQIADDLDEEFDIVLEWPRNHSESIDTMLTLISPLAQNIASIVFNAHPLSDRWTKAINAVAQTYSVAINSNQATNSQLIELANQHKTSIVWHPAITDKPILSRRYQVVCLPCQDLRHIKVILDKLQDLLLDNIRVGLFFEPTTQSTQQAMETRDLIELLGLA